jgi:hypothetical protein
VIRRGEKREEKEMREKREIGNKELLLGHQ